MLFARRDRFAWRLRTRTLALGERTLIMAIVNLTPDSFSGDGLGSNGGAAAVEYALAAVDQGADIVDLGAESTRPGATPLTTEQEQRRLLPVLAQLLRLRQAAVVSVDTYHASTARAAVDFGAEIVNDVSGLLWDAELAAAVAALRCGVVLMHTRGRPQEWAALPPLAADDVLPLVREGLAERLAAARSAGIADEHIVLDPGFGFGKLGAANLTLLAALDRLAALQRPLLAGLSRKGFLSQVVKDLQTEAASVAATRLQATTAANVAAVLAGAHILRVHDVQAAREAAAVADALLAQASGGSAIQTQSP